ncbi:ATP-binding protein [Lysinibacillus capsici]|uniref:histidine kinase n=1 Tax=Lysinibacillus capsici TaxID=2115968 RepID=A0ABY8KAK1_9BACI|nr:MULTISPECIES: ATP-binding protein [Lysinibacillus]WGF36578.1 ATP-binding protein [Lysinibacillus capsici]WNN75786.1 ATP-binding protein [Lysinibacillus capsici]WPK05007.1 ATP-binding protein [Lysinibacillus capsici]
MRKLSLKLGIIFFITLFCIETFMMFFLHVSLTNSRVEEELERLQARGNSHRTILEQNFNNETLAHVVLMESEASTDVVVTDHFGTILASSQPHQEISDLIREIEGEIPYEGRVLQDNWQEVKAIATISPIQNQQGTIGYVFMFQNTDSIHALMKRLNKHFLIVGIVSGLVSIAVIVVLSRKLAKPLIQMKEATLKMSKGDFTVALSTNGKDELGDLSNAIQLLSNDLNHLRQERKEFLSSIAHELRTPLTFIKGYTDILAKRDLTGQDRQKYLAIIIEETNRLSRLIKDLFDLAKMDENSFVIEKHCLHLEPFFTSIEEKLSPAFQDKGIYLVVRCDNGLTLCADEARLEQILINLLNNALIYCAPGDMTTVTVKQDSGILSIIVEDTGKGIPKKDLPYIFDRFYRVEKSRSRALGGSGLGLAIVKELVQAHGGEIKVRSEINKGTTFELSFKGVEMNENDFMH